MRKQLTDSILGFLLLLLFLVAGCNRAKTMREFSKPFNESIDALVADMEELSEGETIHVFYKEDFNYWERPFDPKPYFHIADGKSNTLIVNFGQLFHLSADLGDSVAMYLSSTLEHLLEDRYLSELPSDQRFYEEVPLVGDIRYFVVYYPVGFEQAIVYDSEQKFVMKPLDLAVGLYDRASREWLMLKHFHVDPPEELEYRYRETAQAEDAKFALRNYYAETAQPLMLQWLTEATGGTFETDMRAPRRDGTSVEF